MSRINPKNPTMSIFSSNEHSTSRTLEPLTTIDGFPLLVIEFMKTCSPNKGIKLPNKPPTIDLEKIYHGEKHKFTVPNLEINEGDPRVCCKRWLAVDTIVVVPPSKMQTYFCESLDNPHYSVHPIEYQSYLIHLRGLQETNGGSPNLYYCSPNENHHLVGLITVTNVLPVHLKKIIHNFDGLAIATAIEENGVYDIKRGNRSLDTGLASGKCQVRKLQWHGMSGPNVLKHTHDSSILDMRKNLYNLISVGVPPPWWNKLYHNIDYQELFEIDTESIKSKRVGQQIHSCRAAMTYKYSQLVIHRDSMNDNADVNFAPVFVVSWLVFFQNVPTRIALITYSRKFVADTFKKIQRYSPVVKHITEFYNEMKIKGRHEVTQSIFHQEFTRSGNCNLQAARIPPILDTCVHWSSMGADALLQINRLYRPTYQQGMALLISVCASNSPDYFRVITNQLIQNMEFGKSYFQEKAALQIAIEVYEMIFNFKVTARLHKKKLLGQRHQPCSNIQASREAISHSLNNLIEVHADLSQWDQEQRSLGRNKDVRESYNLFVKRLCEKDVNGGVFGAGPLIANKILQMGALVGLFPFQFLFQSKIAVSTNTCRFLQSKFGLDDMEKESPILLEAIAFTTGSNVRIAEGTCCKAAQSWTLLTKGTTIRATDTIFPEMSILCPLLEDNGRLGTVIIKEVTNKGVSIVDTNDLCWLSEGKISKTPWAKHQGYWMGTVACKALMKRSTSTTIHALSKEKSEQGVTEKVAEPPCLIKKPLMFQGVEWSKVTRSVVESSNNQGHNNTLMCDRNDIQKSSVVRDPSDKGTSRGGWEKIAKSTRNKTQKTKHIVSQIEDSSFIFPTQADVLMSLVHSRKAFNKWKLLGEALGMDANRCASKRNIEVRRASPGLFYSFIKVNENDTYYPKEPCKAWENSGFVISNEGVVCFPEKRVARSYTIMKFLEERYTLGLQAYFSNLMTCTNCEYTPQHYQIGTRRRIPQKMIVFYDNDCQNCIEAMAVCLLFRNRLGAFSLVDDFGRVIKEDPFLFEVNNTVLHPSATLK
jgi:hypothetical protein